MEEKKLGGKILDFYTQRYQNMAGFQMPGSYPSLYDMISELSQFPDEVFSLYGFRRDVLCNRVSSEERDRLIQSCLQDGIKYARMVRERFGALSPSELAQAIGITVNRPHIPTGGGRVLFAEFEEPAQIRIYQSAIQNADAAIVEHQLEPFFGGVKIEDILIAHELFHWVEMEYKDTVFSLNYRVELWKLGPYRHHSRMGCLSEITAMAFAKELTGLPFSPYLLDVFLSYTYQPDLGGSLYHEIRNVSSL